VFVETGARGVEEFDRLEINNEKSERVRITGKAYRREKAREW